MEDRNIEFWGQKYRTLGLYHTSGLFSSSLIKEEAKWTEYTVNFLLGANHPREGLALGMSIGVIPIFFRPRHQAYLVG